MMPTAIEQVARDIQTRAEQVRVALAERERAYRRETQEMRDELARLDAALRAIAGEPQGPKRQTPASPASSPRAKRGENRLKILRVVDERPGVGAAEVAQSTGIARPVVYSTLAKLAQAGEIEKVDVNGSAGYRVADQQGAAA